MELLKESWATDDGKNRSFTLSPEHIRVFLLNGDTKELEHLTTSAGRTANDSEDADIPVHRDVTYFVVEYFHKVPAYMYRTVKIVQLHPSVYSHHEYVKRTLECPRFIVPQCVIANNFKGWKLFRRRMTNTAQCSVFFRRPCLIKHIEVTTYAQSRNEGRQCGIQARSLLSLQTTCGHGCISLTWRWSTIIAQIPRDFGS